MPNTIEQLSVKAVGTLKAVKAGFNGLRGVFLHLAEEHGELSAMMNHASKSEDAQVRREHYAKVRAELLSHERAELAEVYPALARYESTRDLVLLHEREATQLESAIRTVDTLDPASEAWDSAFGRLLALVQEHVDHEEKHFFPRAQAALGDAAAEALRTRYETAKSSAKKQLA
jgi:hypothetical protein